jgi:hypothetical protein
MKGAGERISAAGAFFPQPIIFPVSDLFFPCRNAGQFARLRELVRPNF